MNTAANIRAAETVSAIHAAGRFAEPPRVSLDNGHTFRPVSDLSDDEVACAVDLTTKADATCREAAHNCITCDDPRAYLAAFCAAHEGIYDESWIAS
jgi:hypothetical protein